MESWRFDPLCIAEDDLAVNAPSQRQDKFRIKMLMRDGERRRETDLLIQKRYAWRGYGQIGTEDEPNQLTMNAELFGRVYATLTVNIDSPAGLALDSTYGIEAARLRSQGSKLCEFGRFAIDPSARSKRLIISLVHLLYIMPIESRAAPISSSRSIPGTGRSTSACSSLNSSEPSVPASGSMLRLS
jgi:hypothetical protein